MSDWKIIPKRNKGSASRLGDNIVSVIQNKRGYNHLNINLNITKFLGEQATVLVNETEIALLPAGDEGRKITRRPKGVSSRLVIPLIDLVPGQRTTRMEEIPGFGMAVIFSKTPDL